MKITAITLNNYMCYPYTAGSHGTEIEFTLSPTVITGPNNSGKTTIVRAIVDMCRSFKSPNNIHKEGIFNDTTQPSEICLSIKLSESDLDLFSSWLFLTYCNYNFDRSSMVERASHDKRLTSIQEGWAEQVASLASKVLFESLDLHVQISLSGDVTFELHSERINGQISFPEKLRFTPNQDLNEKPISIGEVLFDINVELMSSSQKSCSEKLTKEWISERIQKYHSSITLSDVKTNPITLELFQGGSFDERRAKVNSLINEHLKKLNPYLELCRMSGSFDFFRLLDIFQGMFLYNLSILCRWQDVHLQEDATSKVLITPWTLNERLFDIKNSMASGKFNVWKSLQDRFKDFTKQELDVTHICNKKPPEIFSYLIDNSSNRSISLWRSGSGLYELLLSLVTLHRQDRGVVFLDEPAVSLHPPLQKRLLRIIEDGIDASKLQVVFITHSVHQIPINSLEQCLHIFKKGNDISVVCLGESNLKEDVFSLQKGNGDLRQLLFTDKVLLCEGADNQALYSKCMASNPDDSFPIIYLLGKGQAEKAIKVCKALNVKYSIILDGKFNSKDQEDNIRQIGELVDSLSGQGKSDGLSINQLIELLEKENIFLVVDEEGKLSEPEDVYKNLYPDSKCRARIELGKWLAETIDDDVPQPLMNVYKKAVQNLKPDLPKKNYPDGN